MRIVFLLLFIIVSLNATSILEEYRKNGIKNIEKKLDTALTKEKNWSNNILDTDTKFGYIEKYTAVLVCDKNSSTLKLYTKDINGTFTHRQTYRAFTGKNKGDKQTEGDFRTPVGIYTLVKKLSKIDSFYGPLAFVTSYPNLYDRFENKNGHGIWIHGLPIDQKRDEFTKGCIAIDNDGLKCLERTIDLDKTVLLIFENERLSENDPKLLVKLAAWLYSWRKAWKYNDFDRYISYYAPDFKRFDGKNFEQFKRYKKRIFAKKEKKSILFNDINIIPYPNHENIFQITFYERYKSDNYSYNGDKELLVRLTPEGVKIFSEQ